MLSIFDGIRDISLLSVTIRIILTIICGGIIGIEREFKRRPAGFRTHILVCMGAATATATGQFLFSYMDYYTDMARFGAQVIAGIGFIGAGTIISRREKVRGLTTAAGLWTDAIIGLAIGAGFYEGGLAATFLVLISELFLARVERKIIASSTEVSLYVEYADKETLESILEFFRKERLAVENMEITRAKASERHHACAMFTLIFNKGVKHDVMIHKLGLMDGVFLVEEL